MIDCIWLFASILDNSTPRSHSDTPQQNFWQQATT
jgi:hypothetical protein